MLAPETEIIVIKDGAEILRKTVGPGDYVIGREQGCDMRVNVELVSRRHAQLTVNFDHALIEDLGSSNGTFVNGQPVTEPTRLWPNQKIQIGAATIELRRLKTVPPPDVSLAPQTAAVQRLLPEELLRDKKYDIGKVVAQGGMGAILAAGDAATQREVAMKVLLDGSNPDDLTRFVAEARVTAQLEHPNVVPVHELSVDENGQPFYTMKMVRGVTLRKVLELLSEGVKETESKYPLPALLTIFQKVCDAIAFAHSRGVIHRDLKPENIMLDDFGVVLVMDWGLAKVVGSKGVPDGARPSRNIQSVLPEASGATLAGTIMGTPQYMSPEQARGEVVELDVRSDIYALGAILYQILTLRPPVTGQTAMEIVSRVAEGHVEPLTAPKNRPIPGSLAAVVRKAMAFDRDQRYWLVDELQRDLTAYQDGFATSAEKAGLSKQVVLAVKRHKVAALGVAAVLVVGVTFGTKALVEGRRAEREAVRASAEAARANRTLADLKKTAPTLLALAGSEAGFQRFDSALEKLDAALALDPALTAGWWRRVWLLIGMERYGEAAAAFRTAQQRDPAEHAHDAFLPILDALAAGPDDTARFTPERASVIFQHLTRVRASGELNALSKRLTLNAKQREQLVRRRLDEWLGKNGTTVKMQPEGTIHVSNLPQTIDSLEPLHGLPIDAIDLHSTAVKSLEPLRGMALRSIEFAETRTADLSPLRGMPLTYIGAANCDISDLSPLAGMPLRILHLQGTKIRNLDPLRGCPLQTLNVTSCKVVDFSALRGAPLKDLDMVANRCSNLSFLVDAPLETLVCNDNEISDLAPLRGKSLKMFSASRNHIVDLRPLARLPLTELYLDGNPITDYAPLLELPHLARLRISIQQNHSERINVLRGHPSLQYIGLDSSGSSRPVAEFWADYDAQHPAAK